MQNNLKSLQDKIKDLQTKLQVCDTPVEEDSKIESKNSSKIIIEKSQSMLDIRKKSYSKEKKKSRNPKEKLNSHRPETNSILKVSEMKIYPLRNKNTERDKHTNSYLARKTESLRSFAGMHRPSISMGSDNHIQTTYTNQGKSKHELSRGNSAAMLTKSQYKRGTATREHTYPHSPMGSDELTKE